jgi:hypothetical protein
MIPAIMDSASQNRTDHEVNFMIVPGVEAKVMIERVVRLKRWRYSFRWRD